jgi:hypothetical protein
MRGAIDLRSIVVKPCKHPQCNLHVPFIQPELHVSRTPLAGIQDVGDAEGDLIPSACHRRAANSQGESAYCLAVRISIVNERGERPDKRDVTVSALVEPVGRAA